MIKSISALQNFGIFSNYIGQPDVDEFSKFNLIYGWNGSGKSTLSKIFECISKGHIISDFPDGVLNIATDTQPIDNKNIIKQEHDICVFNQNFIKENINWDSLVKSILLISKEKIKEKKTWNEKKVELKSKTDSLATKTREKQTIDDDTQKLLSAIAKSIKSRFQILDSTDNYYVSYNKSKVQAKLTAHLAQIESNSFILKPHELQQIQQAISPKFKDIYHYTPTIFNEANFIQTENRLNQLFKETAVSTSIEHLLEHPKVQSWIETGLELHKDSVDCEFCGGILSEERMLKLNNHFSESFKLFKSRLTQASDTILNNTLTIPQKIATSELYEEFTTDIVTIEQNLEDSISAVNAHLKTWQNALDKKTENPFETGLTVTSPPHPLFQAIADASYSLEQKIKAHNQKAGNFSNAVASAKSGLELHFLNEEIRDSKLQSNQAESKAFDDPIKNLTSDITTLNVEIRALEKELNNESIGATDFNDALHKFLGRSTISLQFDMVQKGYKILREPENTPARNLSEGEKNAIGLVYFLTKLSENERDITKSIVVFDDPVSSFDSNNLFNAHAFLRDRCQDTKQLFVLTHSFSYFKLARDWLYGKNKTKGPVDSHVIKSRFYNIEASLTTPRTASIRNAPLSLTNFNSEYHFLYATLKKFADTQTLSMEAAFTVANMSRKLLEAFLTFKYPHGRGNFRDLMDKAIEDKAKCERIYRFINKYSHNQVIEFDDSATDNIAAESEFIVREIFTEIQRLDSSHYDGMEKALAA